MKTRLTLVALSCAALTACGQGYTIDRLRPKTYLVNPQLARYGLAPDQVQCVGGELAAKLSVWQMRLLAMKAGAAVPGQGFPEQLTVRDLLWAASHVKDPQVSEELLRATGICGVPTVSTASIAEAAATAEPALPEAEPDPQVSAEAKSGKENGPENYEPSEDLLKALDAYEGGDFAAAARLGKAAADKGDSGAHQFLGGLYSAGHGLPADPAAAARYYGLAAEQGWSEAMNNLGQAFESGQGVGQDPVEALKWYMLASSRPTEDPELVARNIRHVVEGMSVKQIERAAALAKAWEDTRRR